MCNIYTNKRNCNDLELVSEFIDDTLVKADFVDLLNFSLSSWYKILVNRDLFCCPCFSKAAVF